MPRKRFEKLSRLLGRTEALWRQRPFVQLPVPWETSWPALSEALRDLRREEILRFESHPADAPGVREAIPEIVSELQSLTEWPVLTDAHPAETPLTAPQRIRARKWSLVTSFVGKITASPNREVEQWVDWCSGKGHLGRALHQVTGAPVTCIEKKAALCAAGQRESAAAGVSLRFECRDVLRDAMDPVLNPTTGVVALHACGHLHATRLCHGVARRVPFMAVAPCCYQRIDGMQYLPLSEEARAAGLPLNRHQLRLPSLDETMTGETRRALRRKEHAFRLGVDLLQRQQSGIDAYRPLGPVKTAWLRGDFAHFAATIAREKGVPLPGGIDWRDAEAAGWNRFFESSALSLARGLFRRALESWLLLDRALYLESHGYRATIGTFCDEALTPRNLMILASRA